MKYLVFISIIVLSFGSFAERKEIKLPDFKNIKKRKKLIEKVKVTEQCQGVILEGSEATEQALKNCGGMAPSDSAFPNTRGMGTGSNLGTTQSATIEL